MTEKFFMILTAITEKSTQLKVFLKVLVLRSRKSWKFYRKKYVYFYKYILNGELRYIGEPNVKMNHMKWMSQNKMVDNTADNCNDDNINFPKLRVAIFKKSISLTSVSSDQLGLGAKVSYREFTWSIDNNNDYNINFFKFRAAIFETIAGSYNTF